MDVKELRFGNLVFDGGDRVVIIESINELEVGCFEIHKQSMYDELQYPTCSLSPIPLTEEWLLKFGFSKKR